MIVLDKTILNKKSGIYKITCSINGKVYIGQSISLYRRLQKHLNLKGTLVITKALIKYGVENFNLEIIEFTDSEFLDDREKYWISFYNSTNRNTGYNVKPDGKTSKGVKLSDTTKLNIRNGRIKWMKDNPEKVKEFNRKVKEYYNTPEAKEIQSNRSKEFTKTEKGKENIKNIIDRNKARKGLLSPYTKPLQRICLITKKILGTYNSIADASRKTEKSEKQIRYALGIGSRGLPPTGEWVFIDNKLVDNNK